MTVTEVTKRALQLEKQPIAVFWDMQTCPPCSALPLFDVVHRLQNEAQHIGTIKYLKAYSSDVSRDHISVLRALGCIMDDHEGGTQATMTVDMTVDMMSFAMDYPASAALMVVSNDKTFAHCLSVLRLREHSIYLIVPVGSDPMLMSIAQNVRHWEDVGGDNSGIPLPAAGAAIPAATSVTTDSIPLSLDALPPLSPVPSMTTLRTRSPPPVEGLLQYLCEMGRTESTPPTEISAPRTPQDPPASERFQVLIDAMKDLRWAGDITPLYSKIGVELSGRGPELYKQAGVKKLSEYLECARKEGVVLIRPSKQQAKLTDSY